MSLPAHPFWDFSLSIYREPGVADACLFVQDRYGLNVSLVLFCVWMADAGHGALTAPTIETAIRRIADWEQQVLQPLRAIRRKCRHEALGVPEFLLESFQPDIEAVELVAEHVEQLVLTELARDTAAVTQTLSAAQPVDAAGDAAVSLRAYIHVLDVAHDAQLARCLTVILQAAFPGAGYAPGAVGHGADDQG